MPLPRNPYVAGNPVGGSEAFIGRADVLREVVRVLRRPRDNAIVLYGQRRIGKTSVLQHLETQLPGEGPYRPVYFDLQDKAAWPLGRVLRELARIIAHALGLPDPDLDDDPETAFREEWLPKALDALPEGCSLVLLFDEFDVLADPEAEQATMTFFPYLQDLLTQDRERLQFVFVVGRNVDDLDTIALSLFKGTPAMRVSLLSEEDTIDLVRLSERNDTLRWSDEAVVRVYELTNGHPFLTQQLCSHVWERAYDEDEVQRTSEVRCTSPEEVDAAVPGALAASRNTLEWLWDGLPPAERVVASALAEAGPDPITQEELERLLHESGVRVVIRELQNAPELLQEWDLIEPVDGGYRFRVELLRRWLTEHKSLQRVQEELDRIEPVAENLYQAGSGMYQSGQLDEAIGLLSQAIGLNPNHVRANQLLADILLAQEQPGEARELLERLYEYQPAAARSRLVQALLAEARAARSQRDRLSLYQRVLELHPNQKEARSKVEEIGIQTEQSQSLSNENEAELRFLAQRSRPKATSNPFIYGNPVSGQQFVGRKREVHEIVSRIIRRGQSSAIVGEWRSGKTSLLMYVSDPQNREKLYRSDNQRLLFSPLMDASAFESQLDQTQFWQHALSPLARAAATDTSLAEAYETFQKTSLDISVLKRLLTRLNQNGRRLVMLLDEFDSLLDHRHLNSPEFFRCLRTLLTRYESLTLVIASRNSLERLTRATRDLHDTELSYFNFFDQVILGPLRGKETSKLLSKAGDVFDQQDRRFLVRITGEHPYLLQMAAWVLWDEYKAGYVDSTTCRQEAGRVFYRKARLTLSDIWNRWLPQERKVFTSIALAHLDSLGCQLDPQFNVRALMARIPSSKSQLQALEDRGFITKAHYVRGGWKVRCEVFLWWLTEELVRITKNEISFEQWVKKQRMEGLFSESQRGKLTLAMQEVASILKEGISVFFVSVAEGTGKAIFK